MPMTYRMLFPACASFGPIFIVIGLQGRGTTGGFVCAGAGALMTSAALLMLFSRAVGDGTRTVAPRERRDQLLFWCAMTLIGIVIWLLSEWLTPLR
jgi:hypothetical protein